MNDLFEQKNVIHVDELVKTESSNVSSVAYDEKEKTAYVTFSNSGIYRYDNVNKQDFEELRDAESTGRHLRAVFLKKNFPYEKLEKTRLVEKAVLSQEVLDEDTKKAMEDFGDL